VRAIEQIRQELEAAAHERQALRESRIGSDSAAIAAHGHTLDERVAELWAELRRAKAQVRFGPRDRIVRRARSEERFNRDLRTRKAA
jgi:hypothetical protein